MATFEFVMVVVSIIIGLAITEILTGVLEVLRAKAFERLYWLHTAWVVQILIFAVFHWAGEWNMRSFEGWNYLTLSLLLLPSLALFLASGLLFPKEQIDLREYYYQQRSTFFTILLLLMVFYTINSWVLYGNAPGGRGDRFRLLATLLYLPLIVSRRPRVHIACTAAHALIVLASFTTLFGGRGGRLTP